MFAYRCEVYTAKIYRYGVLPHACTRFTVLCVILTLSHVIRTHKAVATQGSFNQLGWVVWRSRKYLKYSIFECESLHTR